MPPVSHCPNAAVRIGRTARYGRPRRRASEDPRRVRFALCEGIVRGPSATRPIPTVNAVVLAALPVALVVGCLLIARYVDGARLFWDIAVVGFYGLVVAFPGYAGLVAARSATPAPVAVLSAAAPTLASPRTPSARARFEGSNQHRRSPSRRWV